MPTKKLDQPVILFSHTIHLRLDGVSRVLNSGIQAVLELNGEIVELEIRNPKLDLSSLVNIESFNLYKRALGFHRARVRALSRGPRDPQ